MEKVPFQVIQTPTTTSKQLITPAKKALVEEENNRNYFLQHKQTYKDTKIN